MEGIAFATPTNGVVGRKGTVVVHAVNLAVGRAQILDACEL
jgi:hypothetical protein